MFRAGEETTAREGDDRAQDQRSKSVATSKDEPVREKTEQGDCHADYPKNEGEPSQCKGDPGASYNGRENTSALKVHSCRRCWREQD